MKGRLANPKVAASAGLGGALGIIAIALLNGPAHADVSGELGGAISTVCAYLASFLPGEPS